MIEIEKNTREVIRVENTQYKGNEYVSIRVYAKTYDGRNYVPTKKGLTISPEAKNELLRALQSL